MRISTTRHALAPSVRRNPVRRGLLTTCLAAAAILAALVPAPAQASTVVCDTILESTPSVRVDLDGDGWPEYRVPSINDVTLCSDAGASYSVSIPRTENCFVGWHPTCIAVYVDVSPVNAEAGASGELCFRLDNGWPICQTVQTPPLSPLDKQTACIGFDVNGGHPCSGTALAFTFQ